MTSKQADKLIRSGEKVTVVNSFYNEEITTVFISQDRHNVYSIDGGKFDRAELTIKSD